MSLAPPLATCAHSFEAQGTCPFETVWSAIDSGMLLFDVVADRLVWKNKAAVHLLGHL